MHEQRVSPTLGANQVRGYRMAPGWGCVLGLAFRWGAFSPARVMLPTHNFPSGSQWGNRDTRLENSFRSLRSNCRKHRTPGTRGGREPAEPEAGGRDTGSQMETGDREASGKNRVTETKGMRETDGQTDRGELLITKAGTQGPVPDLGTEARGAPQGAYV